MDTDRVGESRPDPGAEGPPRALAGGGAVGVAVLAVGAVLLVAVAVWAWVRVPELYPVFVPAPGAPALSPEVAATRDATRAQSIVTTRASVLAALAGIGALVTIAINFRNSQLNARTLATTQSTFRVTERGHLTDRYTKAIEQLGHDSIAIRLGGIYALQQLAVDTGRDSDQATVVEVLSAFVRLNLHTPLAEAPGEGAPAPASTLPAGPDVASRRPATEEEPVPPGGPRKSEAARSREPRADVLAAISVLAQLPVRTGVPMRADFTGLDFTGLDLSHARLSGADLSGANLARANLAGADLSGAYLVDADLTRAVLDGANLSDANLTRANLVDATLARADLARARLAHADLTLADLTGATLTLADLGWARLARARLAHADLTLANLTRADLLAADIARATLAEITLTGANLARADLTLADLTDANLTQATLAETTLTNATLIRADFTESLLTRADLTRAVLDGADLTNADLFETTLNLGQLSSTRGRPKWEVDGGESTSAERT